MRELYQNYGFFLGEGIPEGAVYGTVVDGCMVAVLIDDPVGASGNDAPLDCTPKLAKLHNLPLNTPGSSSPHSQPEGAK